MQGMWRGSIYEHMRERSQCKDSDCKNGSSSLPSKPNRKRKAAADTLEQPVVVIDGFSIFEYRRGPGKYT